MSEKIEKYNEIIAQLRDVVIEYQSFCGCKQDKVVERESIGLIRELRQIVELLRRLVDDGKPPIEVHSLQDAMKLNKDELAFVAWQFFQWILSDKDCPAEYCNDFPCQYRREQKAMCEENLKNGDLNETGMEDQKRNGYYHQFCDGDQQGCWASYYAWCYLHGYNPLNRKKEK